MLNDVADRLCWVEVEGLLWKKSGSSVLGRGGSFVVDEERIECAGRRWKLCCARRTEAYRRSHYLYFDPRRSGIRFFFKIILLTSGGDGYEMGCEKSGPG